MSDRRKKPQGSRNITVRDHLYYWWTIGSDSGPAGHYAIVMDSVTRKRHRVEWAVIAPSYYPILPRHVAAWIETNL